MDKNQLKASVHPIFLPDHPIRVMPSELKGTVTPPPSKSVAHRAMVCAALSGESDWPQLIQGVEGPLSDDLRATFGGLLQLLDQTDDVTEIDGSTVIDCCESGSHLDF